MKLNKNIAVSESGFIFNPASGDSFAVNNIGSEIIQMLKNEKKKSDIVKSIAEKYHVESSEFEKDLEDFFGQLNEFNLLNNDAK